MSDFEDEPIVDPLSPAYARRRGHIYDLTIVSTEFTATGLDAAYRVARRLNDVIRTALHDDMEVLEILSGPHAQADASPKNFPPREAA